MNRLEEILRVKRDEIERLRPRRVELDQQARERKDFRSFRSALEREHPNLAVIAEIKKASPSAGVITDSFYPISIAEDYELNGANAISVLTDAKFFHGDLSHLSDLRFAVSLPLLRKDFILDEIQVAESVAHGADAILLIVAALEQPKLIDLLKSAAEYKVDALVEVHTQEELNRALGAGAKIVGINNRDLATFRVDLAVTEKLCREVPDEVVLVSESGIKTSEDAARLRACGVDAVLVGEALMRREVTIEQLKR
ncbi:MAG TPA: indole-3-glycerol phosphate synthase TrpC [Chthoniobacterales bacterium]|nr:indole-3-glycerol phosphate synthase TrpC [Chthoniobacterales bacterium]